LKLQLRPTRFESNGATHRNELPLIDVSTGDDFLVEVEDALAYESRDALEPRAFSRWDDFVRVQKYFFESVRNESRVEEAASKCEPARGASYKCLAM